MGSMHHLFKNYTHFIRSRSSIIGAINHVIVIKVFELFELKGINERNVEPRYIHFVFLFYPDK